MRSLPTNNPRQIETTDQPELPSQSPTPFNSLEIRLQPSSLVSLCCEFISCLSSYSFLVAVFCEECATPFEMQKILHSEAFLGTKTSTLHATRRRTKQTCVRNRVSEERAFGSPPGFGMNCCFFFWPAIECQHPCILWLATCESLNAGCTLLRNCGNLCF